VLFFGDDHGGEAMVGRRDAYWASGRSAITNSLLLSVLWAVGTFGADRNVQHWAEPQQSAGVVNLTIKLNVSIQYFGIISHMTFFEHDMSKL
jgi:hypothetical protein